jgi:hypothetical protein
MKKIDLDEVIKDIKNGFSRFKRDDKGYGSIQEKYNLTEKEVKFVNQQPQIKGLRSTKPINIEFLDKLVEEKQAEQKVPLIKSETIPTAKPFI